jgi:hypothetical protein
MAASIRQIYPVEIEWIQDHGLRRGLIILAEVLKIQVKGLSPYFEVNSA